MITTLTQLRDSLLPPEMFLKAFTAAEATFLPSHAFRTGSVPAAATATTPGLAGETLAAPYVGGVPIPPAVTGKGIYLARFELSSTASLVQLGLYDRLWQNSGLSVTDIAAQNVNSVAWPARDAAGTTNGDGVLLGLDFVATSGNGATTATVSYTNSDGVAGRTGTFTLNATQDVNTLPLMTMQTGDAGVRSVQTYTNTATLTTGTISLVALRLVASVQTVGANRTVAVERDAIALGMPRIYDGSVLFFVWLPEGTSVQPTTMGIIQLAQG